jgi:hypothetical protein
MVLHTRVHVQVVFKSQVRCVQQHKSLYHRLTFLPSSNGDVFFIYFHQILYLAQSSI